MNMQAVKPLVMDVPRLSDYLSMSESTLQRLVREGKFPKPRQLSGRRVGWLTHEVDEWATTLPVSELLPPENTGAAKPR